MNNNETFLNKLKLINPKIGNKVSLVSKINKLKDVVLFNTKYGLIETNLYDIMYWEDISFKAAVDKTDFWVKRAEDLRVGSELIDYSKVVYTNNNTQPTFVCKLHNYTYSQRPSHHMAGVQGCVYCAKSTIKYSFENFVKHKEFFKNRYGKIYVLKMTSIDEIFYKVGISGRELKYRLEQLNDSKYKIEIVYQQEGLIEKCFILEQRFLVEFSKYNYKPKNKFKGHTECLTINPIEFYWNLNNY